MNGGLLGLVADYRRMREIDQSLVLATVIETQGSTYRRAGARMLIDRSDSFVGLLSGGCFEADVIAHAKSVFETGQAKLIEYDMRSSADTLWGLGIGCNGAIRILLQRLDETNEYQPFEFIAQAVEQGDPVAVMTIFESDSKVLNCQNMLVDHGVEHLHLPDAISDKLVPSLDRCRTNGSSELIPVGTDSLALSCFVSSIHPPNELMILGAGPDALPLIHFAKQLGWKVTVGDHRPVYADTVRLVEADRVVHVNEHREINTELLGVPSAVLIMTHHLESDEKYLKQMIATDVPYIGLLGPADRRDHLVAAVACTEDDRQRIYGPVGIDLGAELPEEIALSVLAEIQIVLGQRTGQHLSKQSGPIHG